MLHASDARMQLLSPSLQPPNNRCAVAAQRLHSDCTGTALYVPRGMRQAQERLGDSVERWVADELRFALHDAQERAAEAQERAAKLERQLAASTNELKKVQGRAAEAQERAAELERQMVASATEAEAMLKLRSAHVCTHVFATCA